MKNSLLLVSFLAYLLTSCDSKTQQPPLFERMTSSQTGVTFANTLIESDTFNILRFEYMYNGGGVGVGDVNNDGLTDVFFSGNMVSSKLYLNKGKQGTSSFQFEDITLPAGVTTRTWATGVSMVDINQDGWLDIHVCTINPDANLSSPNLFFINKGLNKQGIPTFTESAAALGLADSSYATQAAFFDYDRDGDLDMYLVANAMERFNRNNAKGTVKNGTGRSTDRLYRNDGPKGGHHPIFTNVSKEAGILIEGWGLGVDICDINRDGWPDVYVANDFMSNDLLWINKGDGTFSNQIDQYFKHQSHNSMGTDVADINNDGLLDLVVLDMMPERNQRQKTMFSTINYDRYQLNLQMGYQTQYVRNMLQLNNGNGKFSEIGQLAGVYATDWSWSALFADYDNDGFKDLYITNGYHKDITDLDYITYSRETSQFGHNDTILKNLIKEVKKLEGVKIANYLYHNTGQSSQGLRFTNVAQEWGLDQPSYSNGAAYADFDNDGDLDLVVNNINDEAFIYQNHLELRKDAQGKPLNHYLRIRLEGEEGNKAGLGAKVALHYAGQQQYHEHSIVRGYKSTVEDAVHFGLGGHAKVDSILITWPDGKSQRLAGVSADQLLTVKYANATPPASIPSKPAETLFAEVAKQHTIQFKHEEAGFVDFKVQPLLPHGFSKDGPGIAVGDIDGNGLEDFFIGNSAHRAGAMFFQDEKANFQQVAFPDVTKDEEDLGSLLFDADNDGDLDLYVVSGSTEFYDDAPYYQDRLYRNEGKRHFVLDSMALPSTVASGSCVTAADYDHDGDLDLFVGGRVLPRQYPLPAQSYLLRNDKGRFVDATASVAKELAKAGLVTSSLWTDFDSDGWIDLMIVGEWMPITFFKNDHGKLVAWDADAGKVASSENPESASPAATQLKHSSGWWNSLTAGDFDNDGDMDYVAGNLGLNSRYKASIEEPVCIFAKDYDGNNSIDPILCYYIMGPEDKRNLYPAHPRDLLTDQMAPMRKRFKRYVDYGKANWNDMYSEKELDDALKLKSETFQTSYVENLGGGKFRLKSLPIQAQFAPVFGIISDDINGDGNLDLLLTGNSYSTEVMTGMYDASIGLYLQGNGKGDFAVVNSTQSGFMVDGDAKGMAQLYTAAGNSLVLSATNSDSLKVFALHKPGKNTYTLYPSQTMDAYAILTMKDGKKKKQELYYGSTYLSQSSRMLKVAADVQSVVMYDFTGKGRPLNRLAAATQATVVKTAHQKR